MKKTVYTIKLVISYHVEQKIHGKKRGKLSE